MDVKSEHVLPMNEDDTVSAEEETDQIEDEHIQEDTGDSTGRQKFKLKSNKP